jgi:hypothetical protein
MRVREADMGEVTCGTTHYAGCACHEARRDAEVAALKERCERLERALKGLLAHFTEPGGLNEEICRDKTKFREAMAAMEKRTQERVTEARAALAAEPEVTP